MTITECEYPDYYNQDGDPRMAPDYCPNAEPEGAECRGCFWYDGDLDQCRYAGQKLGETKD